MSRILVAEDDPHILRVICMWLSRQGHEVREARNGLAALQQLCDQCPDILITDINMPGMDGLELLRHVTSRQPRPHGIVVLTNRWDHRKIGEQLANAGVLVMPKPFSPSKLAELIQSLGAAASAAARSTTATAEGIE